MIKLWIFDRSGSYNYEKFDIYKDPNRFIRVMTDYVLMSDKELNMNIYIKEDRVGK